MKKQVVVIHGGMTFKNYKEYIDSLKNREVGLDKFKAKKSWREALEKDLGENFQLLAPKMPNSNNAVYREWKIWFEKMKPFLKSNLILIGHSLGGIFLTKYLSENKLNRKIKALILVAAPFNDCTTGEFLENFFLPKSFKKLHSQAKKVYLVFSQDDPVVPFNEMKKYKEILPNAELIAFKNKEHFNQEHFSEIVTLIKKI